MQAGGRQVIIFLGEEHSTSLSMPGYGRFDNYKKNSIVVSGSFHVISWVLVNVPLFTEKYQTGKSYFYKWFSECKNVYLIKMI